MLKPLLLLLCKVYSQTLESKANNDAPWIKIPLDPSNWTNIWTFTPSSGQVVYNRKEPTEDHRFACGFHFYENKDCAEGGLYNKVEVVWCKEDDNYERTTMTTDSWMVDQTEFGEYYTQGGLKMCPVGHLVDGLDFVEGKGYYNSLNFCSNDDYTTCYPNPYLYFGASCHGTLDQTKGFHQINYSTKCHYEHMPSDPASGYAKKCWTGGSISGFWGLKKFQFRCAPQFDKSKSGNDWTTVTTRQYVGGGYDHVLQRHDEMFVCGLDFQTTTGSSGGYQQVFTGLAMKLCEVARCEENMETVSGTMSSISLLIEPGNGILTVPIFNSYLFNNATNDYCNVLSCILYEYCLSVSSQFDTFVWVDTQNLYVNYDPTQEFSGLFCVQCKNRNLTKTSGTFTVDASCTDNIQISVPLDFDQDQENYASPEISQRNKFVFSSFKTNSIACQIERYYIYNGVTSLTAPHGFIVTYFEETMTVGEENNNNFEIEVKDGENPYQYNFIIQAQAKGGSIFNSPALTLTTECPDHLEYVFTQQITTLSRTTSYIGAEGSAASSSFSAWVPKLPKCTQVLTYTAVEISPANSVQYPSAFFCFADPCLFLDFDVSTAGTISFKIEVTHSQGSFQSSLFSIEVTQEEQSPEIVFPAIDTPQQILVSSDQKFQIDPIMCTTGCAISNYQVSSVQGSIVPVEGLTISLNGQKIEVVVTDTSMVRDISFYVYAEVANAPSINDYTSELLIKVVCGSESIVFTQDSLIIAPYELGSGDKIYQLEEAIFSSDESQCPITGYSTTNADSRVTFSTNQFTVKTDSSFRMVEQLQVQTSKITRNFPITFVVCGNEIFTSRFLTVQKIVAKGDTLIFEKNVWMNYFYLSYDEATSHADCIQTEIPQNTLMDETCEGTLSSEVHYSFSANGDLVFDTNYPFSMRSICLRLQTSINKKVQYQQLQIQVKGSEIVTLNDANGKGQIEKLYFYNQTSQVISFKSEGFTFSSDSAYAPVTQYKLMTKDGVYTEYKDTQVIIDQDGGQITVDTSKPLLVSLYIQASTQYGSQMAYLPVNIQICGYEKITTVKPTKTQYYEMSSKLETFYFEKIKNNFRVNDTDCPFNNFTINQQMSFYNDTLTQHVDGDLLFYPYLSEDSSQDVTQKLQIDGFTQGNQISSFILDVQFLGTQRAATLQFQAPYFSQKPPHYEVVVLVNNIVTNQDTVSYWAVLPKIIDPNKREVDPIDLSWKVTKNGEKLKEVPPWLYYKQKNTINTIFFRAIDLIYNLPVVQMEDQGEYIIDFLLQNEDGISRKESVKIKLITVSGEYQDLKTVTLDTLEDIIFIIMLHTESNCGKGMSKVTFYRDYCITNTTKEDYEFCYDVIKDSIDIFFPDLNQEGTITEDGVFQNQIKDLFLKFDSEIYKERYKQWIRNEGRSYTSKEVFEQVKKNLMYEVKGISFDSGISCQKTSSFITAETLKYIGDFISKIDKIRYQIKNSKLKETVVEEEVQYAQLKKLRFYQNEDFKVYMDIIFDSQMQALSEIQQDMLGKKIKIFSVSGFDGSMILGMYQSELKKRDLEELSYSEENLNFTWSFKNQTTSDNKLTIELNFKSPGRVSQNIYGEKDGLILILPENDLIQNENGLTLDPLSLNRQFKITMKQISVNDQIILVSEKAIKKTMIFIMIIQANGLVFNILLSKSLQDIWSLFSTQIITFHLMLFTVSSSAPANIYKYNSYVSQFVQKDMYPTDEIYPLFFDFSESESVNEQFEDLGYEGANFVELTGSLLINIIFIILSRTLLFTLNKIIKKFFSQYEYARRQGLNIQSNSSWATIFEIYLQGYLELFMCAVISFLGQREQDLYQTTGDKFAAMFMYTSLIVLLMMPFAISFFIFFKKDELRNPDFVNRYGFIFRDLSTNTPEQAIFNLIYMIRRIVFVLIIVFLSDYCFIQIIAHTVLTLVYTWYILAFKPFINLETNKVQVFNEISVLLTTYVLITLSDQNISYSQRSIMGYCYILSCSGNMFYNLHGVLMDICYNTIPQLKQKYKIWKDNVTYEKQIKNWLEQKAKKSSLSKVDMEIYQHSKLIITIREQKKKLGDMVQDFQIQKNWMKENQLSLKGMVQMLREINELKSILRANITQLEKENRRSGIRWGEHLAGLNSLLYSRKVVGSSNLNIYHHNSTNEEYVPYNFSILKYCVITPFLSKHDVSFIRELDFELQNQLEQRVIEHNSMRLNVYLQNNGYFVVLMRSDGNCGPRAIAERVYGTQNRHKRVRREICQYLNCQPKYWGNQRGEQNFGQFIKTKLQKNAEWFTDTEFKAAAKLYNIPIIIFSGHYSTPNFDMINEALTFEGNNQEPLFIHHVKSSHFNVLVHPKQQHLYQRMQPFLAYDFDVDPVVFPPTKKQVQEAKDKSLQNKVQQNYRKDLLENRYKKHIKNCQWDFEYLDTINEEEKSNDTSIEAKILYEFDEVIVEPVKIVKKVEIPKDATPLERRKLELMGIIEKF